MKTLIAVLCLAFFATVPVVLNAAEILIVEGAIPGNKVIEMTMEDVALITPDAIAGSEIKEVKVEGRAKAKPYTPKVIGEAGQPNFGPTDLKVLVTPSGKGRIKVIVVVKQPTDDNSKTITYTFEVK